MRTLALAGTLSAAAAAGALAHTATSDGLQVIHPWVAPAKAGADTTAHPTVMNETDAPVTLTRVTTKAARDATMIHDGDAVERVAIAGGATLPAGRFQLRLRTLTVDLPEGQAVPVTFHRADGEPVTIAMAIGETTMQPEQTVALPQ
jgi:copper(I)-binding protein